MTGVEPSFRFDVDHGARLVRVTLRGQHKLSDVEDLTKARTEVLTETHWKSGEFDYLADLRATGVQPMDVAAAARFSLAQMPIKPRRFAVLAPSALTKMQVSRITDHEDLRFFTDEDAALAWLNED
ncbi:STAS/SEC14 domain-containing protein [Sphingomonas bacterium]|uniref:STAS/SEC14 domain-containing protein n=1 Tax=Sphingomonas bacterium TaxID=1895847 RepID=UPI00157584BF|nr:STAS/SEC14 domain-containing protein [Sphingomonas bacterium]